MIKNLRVRVDGSRWLIREAKSLKAARSAITMAQATGSIGSKTVFDETRCGGEMYVHADVVQINSDNTERAPYTMAY